MLSKTAASCSRVKSNDFLLFLDLILDISAATFAETSLLELIQTPLGRISTLDKLACVETKGLGEKLEVESSEDCKTGVDIVLLICGEESV